MATITTSDGTAIYYKDWGQGPVVTFSHGWPLNADAWDGQRTVLSSTDDTQPARLLAVFVVDSGEKQLVTPDKE